ncbi:hypothetical protein GCM10027435_13130 [Haloparvum alkalitolerans]|uniref:hypothetical protein n=1 Tax=Haloparvum alkalitolerans TaxID=1042953 RepID=UPI003CF0EEE6
MAEAALLIAVLLALVAPLVLYALVRDEHERDRETVDGWDEAERTARKDADAATSVDADAARRDPDAGAETDDGVEKNGWGRRD